MKSELSVYEQHTEQAFAKVRSGEFKKPEQGNQFMGTAKDQIHHWKK